jgi:hypothetical protein
MFRYLFNLSALLILFSACSKNEHVNPFDPFKPKEDVTIGEDSLSLASLAGLHQKVFKPTCANSGCHDGNFEPDFRTIESTYNTLVMQPIIKNDPQNSFSFRVIPGDPNNSQLVARLTYDIDGNSGIMPLVIEPDSDWLEKRADYIQHIRNWIEQGAPDVLDN